MINQKMLSENDIGNSRDTTFGDMVLSATNQMGCYTVICCLKGELKNTSFHCCGPSSTMFDTDQISSNESYSLGMHNLSKERSYVTVDLTKILSEPESKEAQMLHSLVAEGIAIGEVRPLSRVCFAAEEAARAFRLVAASRHRGRTLLRFNHEPAAPLHRVLSERTPVHLIICESNTLGMQVAEKIIACGPNKLHLHFNASQAPRLNYKLRVWKKMNIEVVVTSGELKEMSDVSNLLQEAASSGTVEELYMLLNPAHEDIIEKLNLATKVAYPSLKRFVVVSKDMYCGYNTCVQRAKSGLPATLLDLSMLDTVQNVYGGIRYQGAVIALQRALSSKDPVLLALPERITSQSLIHQIAAWTDLKYSNKNGNKATLEGLGMPVEKAASVSAFLRDVYHYSLDEEDVMKLTIESINEIESMGKIEELEEGTGLGKLISYVDTDELLATTEMIPMPTVTNNCIMGDDEINVNEMFLCIVPGLEGHHERFRALCERLKLPAVVLQPGLDYPHETPAELAVRYSKVLLKKTKEQKQFYILGYETGVLVALELAAILEHHGGEGTVFCMGAGPEEMGVELEQVLQPYGSSGALQAAVARHMCALMGHEADEHAERALSAASSWGARVDACVRALRGRVPHSAQYARGLIEAAYGRIEAARRAVAVQETPRALRSRLVLLRARTDSPDSGARACSLQRFSQRALHVRDLATPLAHATADSRAPAIINSFLDPQLMEAFDNKNLCDTYLVNTDAFMIPSAE